MRSPPQAARSASSSIAEAEANGKIGTDARYEEEQAKPGAG
ncbi:hypothetical protein [Sphingomonas sp. M1A8_2b]